MNPNHILLLYLIAQIWPIWRTQGHLLKSCSHIVEFKSIHHALWRVHDVPKFDPCHASQMGTDEMSEL